MRRVSAIVDGGMIGSNPGKGGWGGAFRVYNDPHSCDETQIEDEKFFGFSFGEEIVTNNVAEWRAIIGAMQMFIEHYYDCTEFEIYSDSKVAVMQANGIWECHDEHLARLKFVFDQLAYGMRTRLGSAKVTIKHLRREYTEVAHDHIAKILGRTK